MSAAWNGPGEDLRGATFGALTVEGPAASDERGVRVLARCTCGRLAVRHVADLASGRSRACSRCRPAEDALRSRAPEAPARPRTTIGAELPPFFLDAKLVEHFFSRVAFEPTTGCAFWLGGLDKDGYGKFSIHDHEASRAAGRQRQRHVRAHRFALATKLGRWPHAHLLVCHRCDIPCCVAPDHLSEGTQKENLRGMYERGRLGRRGHIPEASRPRGARHGMAKLDDAQVRELRQRRREGERPTDLARTFGIKPSTVWAIATERSRRSA